MKYGIYYAYWEQEWASDYIPYIEKVAKLGFDFLEIACTPINGYTDQQLKDILESREYLNEIIEDIYGCKAD